MPNARLNMRMEVGGVSINGTISRDNTGQDGQSVDVAAAKTGELTTRTDDNTGTLTMDPGHGILTGAKVDIYWTSGGITFCQRNVTVGTVSVNSVPFDLGTGDNLPVVNTDVVVSVHTEVFMSFSGDEIDILAFVLAKDGRIEFYDGGSAVGSSIPLTAGEPQYFASGGMYTNPLTGENVTHFIVTHGYSGGTAQVNVGLLYNSLA